MKINVQSIKFDADQKLLDFNRSNSMQIRNCWTLSTRKSASWKSFLTISSAVMSLSQSSLTTARQ